MIIKTVLGQIYNNDARPVHHQLKYGQTHALSIRTSIINLLLDWYTVIHVRTCTCTCSARVYICTCT